MYVPMLGTDGEHNIVQRVIDQYVDKALHWVVAEKGKLTLKQGCGRAWRETPKDIWRASKGGHTLKVWARVPTCPLTMGRLGPQNPRLGNLGLQDFLHEADTTTPLSILRLQDYHRQGGTRFSSRLGPRNSSQTHRLKAGLRVHIVSVLKSHSSDFECRFVTHSLHLDKLPNLTEPQFLQLEIIPLTYHTAVVSIKNIYIKYF